MQVSAIAGKFTWREMKKRPTELDDISQEFSLSIKPMAIYPHLLVAGATRNSEDFEKKSKKKKKTRAHATLNDLVQRGPPHARDWMVIGILTAGGATPTQLD